jgi:putative FmdB family regulatory protein
MAAKKPVRPLRTRPRRKTKKRAKTVPTYDYECGGCGETFEIFHSMTAPAKRKCPGCGKQKLKRLIGAGGGIIFKGSGFYETDYRSADYKAKAKADSDSGSKSDTKKDSTDAGGGTSKKSDSTGGTDAKKKPSSD